MSVTEMLSLGMAKQEIRACLLLHPSNPQFGGSQSEDVPGPNLSAGQEKTLGQDKVLCWRIQLASIAVCLQLSATAIDISPAMGYPHQEPGTAARNPAPKGCREVVKLSHSRTVGPTLGLPACAYSAP